MQKFFLANLVPVYEFISKISFKMASNFICIQDAPTHWNKGFISGMFSQYGPIEDIEIQSNPKKHSNFVVVEFEEEEDAVSAVEDHARSELKVRLYKNKGDEDSAGRLMMGTISIPTEGTLPPRIEAVHCFNTNCTNQMIIEGSCESVVLDNNDDKSKEHGRIYCSHDCYSELMDMKGRSNIYDKFIASMGRSGTGLIKVRSEMDKIVVKVDPDGFRSAEFKKETDKVYY